MKTYIYTLADKTGIRYIGKSDDPFNRLKNHLKDAKKQRTRKEKWIYSLLKKEEKPVLEILDEVEKRDWSFFEKYWISQFRSWEFLIINGTDGGEGSNGFKGKKHTEETKQLCRIASKKRKKTSLKGEANGRAKLNKNQIDEIKEKIHLGHSRKNIAEEFKISKAYISLLLNGKRWKYIAE